jgi:hypothetical protein
MTSSRFDTIPKHKSGKAAAISARPAASVTTGRDWPRRTAGRVVTKEDLPPRRGPAGRICHNASPPLPERHGRGDPKQKNAGF